MHKIVSKTVNIKLSLFVDWNVCLLLWYTLDGCMNGFN